MSDTSHLTTSDDSTDKTTSTHLRYLQELMQDLTMMTTIYENNNSATFLNSRNLLLREIQRVYALVFQPSSEISDNAMSHENKDNHNSATAASSEMKFEKNTKIFFPDENELNMNLVGRVIGPRGMTIRQLENDYECNLFIRGKGCMRDEEKESRLRGKPGWQHLDEKLHVVIVTKGETEQSAVKKLICAEQRLNKLLNNPNDDLKKKQLVQLAVIEGTLRE